MSARDSRTAERRSELKQRRNLERAGRSAQREAQLRRRQVELEASEKEIDRQLEAIRRQFLELADIHGFQSLDPVRSAPIPYVDGTQDADARTFRRYAFFAGAIGTVVAGGLFVASLAVDARAILPLSLVLAGLLGGVFAGVVIVSTQSNARNPAARAKLMRWNNVSGALAALSLLAILWLRFVGNVTALELIGIPVAVFEMSMYALAGSFAALANIYRWSRDLATDFKHGEVQRVAVTQDLATVSVELMDLEYLRGDANERVTESSGSDRPVDEEAWK